MAEWQAGVSQVLTIVNIVTAIIGGGLAGFFLLGQVAADPAWVSPSATPKGVGILAGSYSIAVGALFYLGQTVASAADGDPGWPRILSRFFIWLVFCVAIGFFTYLRLSWHADHRRREARKRARTEMGR